MLKNIPILKHLIPFIGGIVLASYFPHSFISTGFLLLCFFAFCLCTWGLHKQYRQKLQVLYSAVNMVFFLYAGYFLSNTQLPQKPILDNDTDAQFMLIELTQDPTAKEKVYKSEAKLIQIMDGDEWVYQNTKFMVYFSKNDLERPFYGSRHLIQVNPHEVKKATNPNQFNYQRYLFHRGIYHQLFLRKKNILTSQNGFGNPIVRAASGLRLSILQKLKKNKDLEQDEFAVISALVLGQKEELTTPITQAFSSAGAMHILAVSGLHVGIVYMLLATLLKPLEKIKQGAFIKVLILFFGIWFYALLTGFSPSVIRASTMFSFVALAQVIERRTNIYNTLFVSAFAILIWKPFMIMEVGMQLSYLAVLGIVSIQPALSSLFYSRWWIIQKAWEITCVSIAAQLATFPLGILYFHQFPNYFLLSNLIVIPAATLILIVGVLAIISLPIPLINGIIVYILKWIVFGLNNVVMHIKSLPFAISGGLHINTIQTWILFALIASVAAYAILFRLKSIQNSLNWLLVLIISFTLSNALYSHQKEFVIYDVGRGSAWQFTSGNESYFYANKDLLEDEQAMLFHVKHHWWALGIDSPIVLTSPIQSNKIYWKESVFISPQLTFASIGNRQLMDIPKDLEVDVLFVHDAFQPYLAQHLQNYSFQILVLSSEPKQAILNQINSLLADERSLHILEKQGAFTLHY